MQQRLYYELWKVIPVVFISLVPVLYSALCFIIQFSEYCISMCKCTRCTCTSISGKMKRCHKFLISTTFEILIRYEKLREVKDKIVEAIEKPPSKGAFWGKICQTVVSTLPKWLGALTAIVFWRNFIIYETENVCELSDKNLDCFSNDNGPLSCNAILELANSSYNCYKFSYDLVKATAMSGGVFTASFFSNSLLVFFALLNKADTCVEGPMCSTSCSSCACGKTRICGKCLHVLIPLLHILGSVAISCGYLYYMLRNSEAKYKIDYILEVVTMCMRIASCGFYSWLSQSTKPPAKNAENNQQKKWKETTV